MSKAFNDRNPEVFFVETIDNKPFIYDGEKYMSVFDCFRSRAIYNNKWNPKTVPEFHQRRLNSPIGFVINYDTNLCYTFNCPASMNNIKAYSKQFSVLVCAELFTVYFKQIYSKYDTGKRDKLMRRYGEAYAACMQLCSGVTLTKDNIELKDYDVSNDTYEYCSIVYDGSVPIPKNIKIPECYSIHMSQETFKSLSKNGYSWVSLLPKNLTVYISCDDINDYYWELVRMGGYEPELISRDVEYSDGYTIFLSKTDTGNINTSVDWNNAYVYGA